MYVRSHVDVPALFRLAQTMKREGAPRGECAQLDLKGHVEVKRPANWNKWHAMEAAKRRYENTEALFGGLTDAF